MFVKFITSKLLRVIVCAAAGLYGLYNGHLLLCHPV